MAQGPGLTKEPAGAYGWTMVRYLAAVLIAGSVYLCYAFADRLAQVLGATSMSVIMRLSSFLLVCIGTQIIWNGLSAMLKSLPVMGHPG